MANHASITGAARPLPLDLIDLDQHPDGDLLRTGASLIRLRSIVEGLEGVIARAAPKTVDGLRMKALVA
jgi:hypothetical protein